MMNWVDKAYSELEDDYDNGYITKEEYQRAVWELNLEIQEYNSELDGCCDR